jgi:hypothetical protein
MTNPAIARLYKEYLVAYDQSCRSFHADGSALQRLENEICAELARSPTAVILGELVFSLSTVTFGKIAIQYFRVTSAADHQRRLDYESDGGFTFARRRLDLDIPAPMKPIGRRDQAAR